MDEELFHHDVQAWTVGDLRRALDGIPDDTPLRVDYPDRPGDDFVETQVVVGAGHGVVGWGDGRVEDDPAFSITCDFPTGDYYRKVAR